MPILRSPKTLAPRGRGGWILLLLLCLGSPARGETPAPDPGGPGYWAVGHRAFDAVDPARGDRELRVDLWYPADPATAAGPPSVYPLLLGVGITSALAIDDLPVAAPRRRPLVLFSHGSGGINTQSTTVMEILASHGFVVAAPNHTGNSTFDEAGDEPFEDPATDRPKDISFLIDRMLARNQDPGDPLYDTIRPEAIGVTGHSFGGFTALAMAAGYGASPFGAVPPDPRVRAILPVSGSSGAFGDAELASIFVPALFLGGTLDTAVPIDPNATRPFGLLSSRALYRADIRGATHTHFANICDIAQLLLDLGLGPETWPAIGAGALVGPYNDTCIPPAFPLVEAQRIQSLYTVAFFRRHLYRDPRYSPFLSETYAILEEPDVDFFVRETTVSKKKKTKKRAKKKVKSPKRKKRGKHKGKKRGR